MTRVRHLTALAAAALAITGCGRDTITFGQAPADSLVVRPAELQLYRGQPFAVDVIYSTATDSRSVLADPELTLDVQPADVATINPTGAGVAAAPGDATIGAQFAGLSAAAAITVLDAELLSITADPSATSLQIGDTQSITVRGALSDGSTVDLSAAATGTTYTSEDEAVCVVSPDGLITAISAGQTLVRVLHGPFVLGVNVEVREGPNEYVALRIEPEIISLSTFDGVEFRVIATRSSGEDVDAIAEGLNVGLSVDDPGLVQVSAGFIESFDRPGVTSLTATLDNLTAFARIDVSGGPAELIGLIVEPEFITLQPGEQVQVRVTGFYSDGSSADLTNQASGTTYLVENRQSVRVGANGLVQALAPGAGVVIARNQGLEAGVFVEVFGQRELIGLEVQPQQLRLDLNQQVQLTVLAFYSDGAVEDVTPRFTGVQYFPPPTGIVDVSPDGLVQALLPGDDLLIVEFQGFQAVAPVTVTRNMNQVVRVRVEPRNIRVDTGQPFFGLNVIAVFSDGSEQSVIGDPNLAITTDDPNVAAWDGIAVVGLQAGTTVLRAVYQGVTGTARVQVEGQTSILLGIQISGPTQIGVGQTEPLSVFAFFSDGSIVDITLDPQLMLTVDAPGLLSVTPGSLTGLLAGQTTVRAFYQGQQATLSVQITTVMDPIVSIRFQPASLTLNVGQQGRTRVLGTRASGIEQNLSGDPQLIIAGTGPITVTTTPSDVLVNGTSSGNGSAQATYQGLNATLSVTVQSTGPTLDGIQIIAPGQVTVGSSELFAVIAFFSDGSIQEITNDLQLNLTVSPAILAFLGNQISALSAGTAVVTATYQGQSAQTTIIVSAVTDMVVGLAWQPSTLSIPLNQRRGAALIATFASGATADVTFDPNVNYTFPPIVTPLPGPNGAEFVGDTVGTGQVTAVYSGRTATLSITVTSSGPTVTRIILNAPANLDLGSPGSYTVTAQLSDGTSIDVTNDPALQVFVENPTIFSAAGGVLTPLAVGTTRLGVTYQGFSAQRTINVVNNNPFTSIRFQPTTLSLNVGSSDTVQVIARRANGATENVTAQVVFTAQGPITLGPGGSDLPVLANAPGTGTVQASFSGLSATLTVNIAGLVPPTISTINPDAVAVGAPNTPVIVNGTLFQNGDTVVVDGVPVPTVFVSATQLRAVLSSQLFTQLAELDVQVVGTRGASNTVVLSVGEPPNVLSFTPDTVVAGSAIDVVAIGTGLTSLTTSAPGLVVTVLSTAPDGSLARLRVSAGANVMPGAYPVQIDNPWGSTTIIINITPATGQMDLVVVSGQVLSLSGTHVFNNITVQTGGSIVGQGTAPLALIATGDIIIRGSIDVSGGDGEAGFTTPADGGAAGPGGGGGGGAADGNTNNPSSGGAGSPAGQGAGPASGAGTPAGDGGGNGAGEGGSGGCGQGGGGGALGGNGGAAGGDQGTGTGGAGGVAGSGSAFGGGTGGGGGSTCGSNSGGGGGGGGGSLILQVALGGSISIEGAINANGGDGGFGFSGTGGGGGGSGGRVEVTAPGGTITLVDTIFARGGRGGDADFGDGGGGGSGGIIVLDASPGGTVNTTLGLLDLTGGGQGNPLGGGFSGRAGAPGTSALTP